MALTFGLLAGEASGDNLGAGLMRELRAASDQEVRFIGIGGERMQAQGLQKLAEIERLAVNGFRDPLLRLPDLIRLLRQLIRGLSAQPVDAFIGVDFNVFNFLLEAALKKRGIPTAHYVSPSVYAWRTGRTKRVAKSADLLLCLYPFEPAFYEQTTVQAEFIGHPLADEISPQAGNADAQRRAREELSVPLDATVLAMLPGSRNSEVDLMIADFLAAAQLLAQDCVAHRQTLHVVIPCLRPSIQERVEQALLSHPGLAVTLYQGNARSALTACDVALVKSGTSTLETMLLHRPMVVSYRLGYWSYQLARRVVRTPYIALPNILAGEALVPELLQYDATPQALAQALSDGLARTESQSGQVQAFTHLHDQLRQGADAKAAAAVLGLLTAKTKSA